MHYGFDFVTRGESALSETEKENAVYIFIIITDT